MPIQKLIARAGVADWVMKGLGLAAFAFFLMGRLSITDFVVLVVLMVLWLAHTKTLDLERKTYGHAK